MTYGDTPDPHAACKERIAELETYLALYRRVKCQHPNTEMCAKLWQENTNRRQLAEVSEALAEEFGDCGCDAMERVAEALLAARKERDEYRRRLAHAESCVDEAFTLDLDNPRPILPAFVPPDGNKFDAVKLLACKYRATIMQIRSIADWSGV